MLDRLVMNRFLNTLDHIEYGAITVVTPNGKIHSFKGDKAGAEAQISIYDTRVVSHMAHDGDVALAESYRDGFWETNDLTQLFLFGLENQFVLNQFINGSFWGRMRARMAYFLKRNTVEGSRKNIYAHYDLGNDFYALWLDPSMTYSSAIFKDETENLEQAQMRKYDRIIDRLGPSGKLLEIGCGWGGFAERALQRGDYDMKGLTISNAQHEFASNRVRGRSTIALEDYRNQTGLYDQIVSIEMFEAVGEKFWPVYFANLKSLLAKKGKAVIQSITVTDRSFENYRRSADPIRTFIFPGGMLPSPSRFHQESIKAGLKITDEFKFGQDYAQTLMHWLKNFDSKINPIKAMGFDEKFIRMWRFYLTYCIAAFQYGETDVVQWELQHAA